MFKKFQISEFPWTRYSFCIFHNVSEKLEANGPQNQLPRQIVLVIHLSWCLWQGFHSLLIFTAPFESTICSSPRFVQVHALFKSKPYSSPSLLQVHAMFKSTPCSSPRLVQVHALFKSTPFSSPCLVQVHALFKSTLRTIFFLNHTTTRVLRPRLFSVHACFRFVSFRFCFVFVWIFVFQPPQINHVGY